MHVVHVTESMHQRTGGPAQSVSQLAIALSRSGRGTAEIIVPETSRDGSRAAVDAAAVVNYVPTPSWSLGCGVQMFRTLREASQRPDALFHLHLMWRGHLVAAAGFARREGKPYIVSPRGSLEPWCFDYRGGRKRFFWNLVERKRLLQAAALHATSMMEAENLRKLIPGRPIAIVPNGLPLPTLGPRGEAGPRRTALFLSRVHPKKGVPLLIEAWSKVRPANWRLLVVGPDELGHAEECRALAAQLGVNTEIEFRDGVSGQAKWDLYREADLFVLPTHSENFGIVVAEALASETPVITTTGAPWAELESQRCGWWTAPTVEAIATALRSAVQLPADQLRSMGSRGRNLIEQRYSIESTSQSMIAVYEWIAGGGPVPDCVQLA